MSWRSRSSCGRIPRRTRRGAAARARPSPTARALAHRMGIPHLTLDLREPFGERVVADFVAEHRAGRTPNPCVRCNGMLRFDAMLDLGRPGSAPPGWRRATTRASSDDGDGPGARARTRPQRRTRPTCSPRCRPALLERVWFPLGELTKPEVRELARRAALPVAEKPDSQDLCFLAGAGGKEGFLRRHAADLVASDPGGEIVDLERPRRRAATPASATSRSASGAASASRRASRSTSSTRTRPAGACAWGRAARSAPGASPCAAPICTARRPRSTA